MACFGDDAIEDIKELDLMRGCCLQLVMNIPFTALYFASYETAKRATMRHANCEESLLIQGVAGINISAPS